MDTEWRSQNVNYENDQTEHQLKKQHLHTHTPQERERERERERKQVAPVNGIDRKKRERKRTTSFGGLTY